MGTVGLPFRDELWWNVGVMRRSPVLLLFAVLGSLVSSKALAFEPPNASQREAAIGRIDALDPVLRRAFSAPSELFSPIPKPGPNDWLTSQPESGQTFARFLAEKHARPTSKRGTLYFLPIGDFPADGAPSLGKLSQFASAFFDLKVSILGKVPVEKVPAKKRFNPDTRKRQLLTTDVLEWLKELLPDDGFSVIAVTMTDLYPDESWNFVFGQASLSEHTGVFSFARYDPAFFGEPRPQNWPQLVLERAAKVLAHETGHMFGIEHCVYFHCLMNGANHMAETDASPLHLCPMCLRKLHSSVGMDVSRRESRLGDFFKAQGLAVEADWSAKRLKQLSGQD